MALGKKVKTLLLTSNMVVTVGDEGWQSALDSFTFQDDIRVIGYQVGLTPFVPDAAVNADQAYECMAELSRHGVGAQPGVLARASWGGTWSAAVVVSRGSDTCEGPFAFPDGHGVDFDDGEVIYLHGYEASVGTVSISCDVWAIVYYVER